MLFHRWGLPMGFARLHVTFDGSGGMMTTARTELPYPCSSQTKSRGVVSEGKVIHPCWMSMLFHRIGLLWLGSAARYNRKGGGGVVLCSHKRMNLETQ